MQLFVLDHLDLLRNLTKLKLLLESAEGRDVGLPLDHFRATAPKLLKFRLIGQQGLANLKVNETFRVVLDQSRELCVGVLKG